jgi:hypothetical protein
VADLSSAALLFSLSVVRQRNLITEWKWKQVEALGRRVALYNRALAAQRAAAPQRLSDVNHNDPAARRLQ